MMLGKIELHPKRRLGALPSRELTRRSRSDYASGETVLRKQQFSVARIVAIMLIVLSIVPAALAANNPGHDTLYVLKIGDNMTGSLNLTGNLTAYGIQTATFLYGSGLDIWANGTTQQAVSSKPTIQAAGTNLYIDNPLAGDLRFNTIAGTSNFVRFGTGAIGVIVNGTLNVVNHAYINGTIRIYSNGSGSFADGTTVGGNPVCTSTNGLCSGGATGFTQWRLGSNGGSITSITNNTLVNITNGTGITTTINLGNITIALSNTGVTAGNYGNGTHIPVFTVNAQGRITSVTNTSISVSSGNVTGSGANGKFTKWTSGSTVGNSTIVSESGSTLTVDGNISTPANFWIGSGASATGASSTAIGEGANAIGSYSFAAGWYSFAGTTDGSMALGPSTTANGTYSMALGGGSYVNGTGAIGIGYAKVNGPYAIAIGDSTNVSHANSVAIGQYAMSTAANQLVIGNISAGAQLNTRIYGTLNVSGATYLVNSICSAGQFLQTSSTGLVSCQTPGGATGFTQWQLGSNTGTTSAITNNTIVNITGDGSTITTTKTVNNITIGIPTGGVGVAQIAAAVNTSYDNRYVARGTWTTIDSYPTGCSAGEAVQVIGDTLTCIAVGGGGITGTGAAGNITMFTVNSTNVAASNIYYSGGNIGLGTSAPVQTLDVIGDVNITGGDIYGANTAKIDLGEAYSTGILFSETADNAYFKIYCADSGGNDVCEFPTGAFFSAGTVYIANPLQARAGIQNDIGTTTIPDDLDVDNGTLYVNSTTNSVGIGTTNPSYKLQIEHDGSNPYLLNLVDANEAANLSFVNAGVVGTIAYTVGADNTNIQMEPTSMTVSGNSILALSGTTVNVNGGTVNIGTPKGMTVIGASGNTGIGTTAPSHLLHVNGTANISGAIYLGNSICSAGQFLQTSSTGLVSCQTPSASGGGNTTGSGTATYIPKWTNSTNLAPSLINETGKTVEINGTITVNSNITMTNGIAISYDGTAQLTNLEGVAIGENSIGARNCVALGGTANTSDDRFCVALGYAASTTSNYQFALGSETYYMDTITWGNISRGTRSTGGNGYDLLIKAGDGLDTAGFQRGGHLILSAGTDVDSTLGQVVLMANTNVNITASNLLIGNTGTGNIYLGGTTSNSRIYDAAGDLTLDSDTAQTIIAEDLRINGNDLLDSGGAMRLTLGASGNYNGSFTVNGSAAKFTVNSSASAGSVVFGNTTGATHFFVSGSSGNVGIGTASPGAKLDVAGQINADQYLTIGNNTATEGGELVLEASAGYHTYRVDMFTNWLRIYNGSTVHLAINGNTGAVTIGGTSTGGNATGAGDLYVTSDIEYDGALYGPGADLAELIYGSGPLEAGDVVVADETKGETVKRTSTPYNTAVVGVVSSDPGILLSKNKGDVPLALSGRVPIKVTAENGPIKPGDLLTTSNTPGHAMRCASRQECQGAIVAKSLGTLEAGTGKITALVMLG